jgi:hypothetical protein
MPVTAQVAMRQPFCWAAMRRNFCVFATYGPATMALEARKHVATFCAVEEISRADHSSSGCA